MCILHTGYKQPDGYGQRKYKGRVVLAHRLAYAQHHGLDVFTMGGIVLHSCDTPSCTNPEHLRLGTVQENVADMKRKQREFCKVSMADAELIRVLFVPYVVGVRKGNAKELAARFGVSRSTVERIVRGQVRV